MRVARSFGPQTQMAYAMRLIVAATCMSIGKKKNRKKKGQHPSRVLHDGGER